MSDRVRLAHEGGLARLVLDWPESRNAIDAAMVDGLGQAVGQLRAAPPRALLISATGPAFSVGGDLRHFADQADGLAAALAAMVPPFHHALLELAELPSPAVAAVHGAVAGGALGVVWCADLVIASDDALFACGFSRLGLTGDGGSSWWLPRLVGLRRAQEMLVGGRVLDARTALDWGLVTEVVPAAELAERAEASASALASGPTACLAGIRRLLLESATRTLGEQLDAETAAMLTSGATADAAEGVRAFAERRSPRFNAG